MPEGTFTRDTPRFTPRRVRKRVIIATLLASDFLAIFVSGMLSSLVVHSSFDVPFTSPGSAQGAAYVWPSLVIALVWPAFFAMERLYNTERLFWGSGEFRRSIRAVTLALIATAFVDYAFRISGITGEWMTVAWVFAVVLAPLGRRVCRFIIGRARATGRLQRPTLIVGSNPDARRLAEIVKADPQLGMRIIGCLATTGDELERQSSELIDDVPFLGYARELLELIGTTGADTLIIVSSNFDHHAISRMLSEVRLLGIDVHISSGLFEVLASRVIVRELNGVPIIVVRGLSLTSGKLLAKRAFDLVVASALVVIGLPFWIVIMLLIKIDSRGPVFFRQQRVGFKGRPFFMYKFRSMYVDAEQRLADLRQENEADGPLFKMRHDPRITGTGKWLRKFSVDEFPQLLNVLAGDMSLVGPRPPLPSETQLYNSEHWRRLESLPGMTGLWQVSGRSDLSFEEMVRLDVFYIENWTLTFDFTILLRTIPVVVFGRGAY